MIETTAEMTDDNLEPHESVESDYIVNGDQYLTFDLGNESYGIDILAVKEIRGWEDATLIPNSPGFVKGVVNLRGAIVPIIDLRIRFDIGENDYLPTTVVIIISGEIENNTRTMGFIVDAVSDVIDINVSDVKPAAEFAGTVPNGFIHGLVNSNDNVVTILDVTHLLSMDN